MATKGRAHHEEAWRKAKKICQLSARQVEMARALGMNPKKLPGLRPGPQQRWKLPVGKFIEACYWKRFGGDPLDRQPHKPEPGSCGIPTPKADVDAPKLLKDAVRPVEDLVSERRHPVLSRLASKLSQCIFIARWASDRSCSTACPHGGSSTRLSPSRPRGRARNE